ncbi:MAG: hypothetical protein QXF25_03450, partial [Candidatus Pacearchaeota archaeon]
ILIYLILKRNPIWSVWAGLISLIISIPLFYFQIFFTAQRLTYYAAVFFFLSCIFYTLDMRKRE